jgi:hypothetical protein
MDTIETLENVTKISSLLQTTKNRIYSIHTYHDRWLQDYKRLSLKLLLKKSVLLVYRFDGRYKNTLFDNLELLYYWYTFTFLRASKILRSLNFYFIFFKWHDIKCSYSIEESYLFYKKSFYESLAISNVNHYVNRAIQQEMRQQRCNICKNYNGQT